MGAVRWRLFALKVTDLQCCDGSCEVALVRRQSYGSQVIPLQYSDRFCCYLVWIQNIPIDYVGMCSTASLGAVRWCLIPVKVTDLQ